MLKLALWSHEAHQEGKKKKKRPLEMYAAISFATLTLDTKAFNTATATTDFNAQKEYIFSTRYMIVLKV